MREMANLAVIGGRYVLMGVPQRTGGHAEKQQRKRRYSG
jgi:hypothetical protein